MTMNEVNLLIIAITFVSLSIFFIILAIAALKTFKKINRTLNSIQKQLNNLDSAPIEFLNHANKISENLHHKMKCLDPIFHSLSNIGKGLERRTSRYSGPTVMHYLNERLYEEEESTLENIAEAIELALKSLNLWQKLKNRGYTHV